MPLQRNSWAEMLEDVVADMHMTTNETISSFVFRNVFFLDGMLPAKGEMVTRYLEDIPHYHHMLRHVYRWVDEQANSSTYAYTTIIRLSPFSGVPTRPN